MKSIGIGLAAALILATLSPTGAWAAAPAVSKDQRAKGMAAAPGLITAGNLDCQLADARMIGASVDPKTKATSTFYELACTGNEGLVVDQPGVTDPPLVFTCAEANQPRSDGKPNGAQCILPGNSDPKAGLMPYIAKTGLPCTPDKMRALGHSPSNSLFELVCSDSPGGYILQTSAPPRLDKPVIMNPCAGYPDTASIKCILTDRPTQLAVVDRLAAQSGKNCTVKDRAFIGVAPGGRMYYEVACQDGKGYVLEQNPNGAFSRVIDCAEADALAGGCKLTDARQAKTEQAGLYTQLAKKAGFQCEVSGYAPFSIRLEGKEVVELACSNRPDGGVGVFATSPGGISMVYDCAHSELKSYRCSLTKPAAAYPNLTNDLKKLGKASCVVSNARVVGLTADQQHGYIEVGCSDGVQGYMIDYTMNPLAATSAIVCTDARTLGGGCALPGNSKKS
jgi:hypothetical protein